MRFRPLLMHVAQAPHWHVAQALPGPAPQIEWPYTVLIALETTCS